MELRAKVLRELEAGGKPVELAKKHNIRVARIYNWKSASKKTGKVKTKVVMYNASPVRRQYKKMIQTVSTQPLIAFSGSPDDVVKALRALGGQS